MTAQPYWIFRHNAPRRTPFTPELIEWLELMEAHTATSCAISREDFEYAELAHKDELQKAWSLLSQELGTPTQKINEELVA